jgi:hypothetical protein
VRQRECRSSPVIRCAMARRRGAKRRFITTCEAKWCRQHWLTAAGQRELTVAYRASTWQSNSPCVHTSVMSGSPRVLRTKRQLIIDSSRRCGGRPWPRKAWLLLAPVCVGWAARFSCIACPSSTPLRHKSRAHLDHNASICNQVCSKHLQLTMYLGISCFSFFMNALGVYSLSAYPGISTTCTSTTVVRSDVSTAAAAH